ncbi:MAG: radical SAM protein [Clostridia bacterium]|nr:radical SAM protein [Clostridia bacterium]
MKLVYNLQKKGLGFALDRLLKYVDKDPHANIVKLSRKIEPVFNKIFPPENFKKFQQVALDKDNIWTQFALSILNDVDRNVVKQMLLSFGIDAGLYGTKTVRKNREKYKCNIPFNILFDPTSACNLNCKGCWSAEYGHHLNLSLEEMQSIVSQGKELGCHFYWLTGGEPLIKKKEVLEICRNNKDCIFLIFTNATLVDEAFCDAMNECGNITLALSLEGDEASNDWRRGEGAYATTIKAMDLLKSKKCLFGVSVCYTRKNLPVVTSDEFVDFIIGKGAKFMLNFNYMPVGHGADKDLIPTPEQRKDLYFWNKKMRDGKTGKQIFIMDFQNDGEYVGGCIAGGRNYFHINSAGDIEPCVFIHFSDSNIRTHTLLEALQNPLFMAYYKNQPFNDNHLRPCPMLENPERLREIIAKTGAKSSDLIRQETADELCSKCDEYANDWAPVADEIWNSTNHRDTHTQYYRDTEEGKKEFQGCTGNCASCNAHKN